MTDDDRYYADFVNNPGAPSPTDRTLARWPVEAGDLVRCTRTTLFDEMIIQDGQVQCVYTNGFVVVSFDDGSSDTVHWSQLAKLVNLQEERRKAGVVGEAEFTRIVNGRVDSRFWTPVKRVDSGKFEIDASFTSGRYRVRIALDTALIEPQKGVATPSESAPGPIPPEDPE